MARAGLAVLGQRLCRTVVHDFSSQPSGLRADVDEPVGSTHDFLVMLHHYHRVAQVAQLLEHLDELVRIAAVQSDARFVQYIQASHQAAAQ